MTFIGGGSYAAIHGDYGKVAGGFQNSVVFDYGSVGGGRQNDAGTCSKSTVATTAIGAGATSLTVGTVSGKANATGMRLMVNYGVQRESFATNGTNAVVGGGTRNDQANVSNEGNPDWAITLSGTSLTLRPLAGGGDPITVKPLPGGFTPSHVKVEVLG